MTDGGAEEVLAGGETPGGSPWQLTVRLNGEERTIDLLVVGSHGGGVSGPQLSPESVIDVRMIGGARDEQHIVGEVVRAVERVGSETRISGRAAAHAGRAAGARRAVSDSLRFRLLGGSVRELARHR